jgi:hypothetical protein
VKVKNVNGTSGLSCSCEGWLNHWKEFSGTSMPSYCSEKNCRTKPECGAHVQKYSLFDAKWYIIPLCTKHNAKTAEMEVVGSTILVPANVSETCAKDARVGR